MRTTTILTHRNIAQTKLSNFFAQTSEREIESSNNKFAERYFFISTGAIK
jgi:hypothetical protein